jgi:hypothetical protein
MPDTGIYWRGITVSRTKRSEALYVAARHLDAMVEVMPEHRLLGWYLNMSRLGTVRAAVIYEDSQSETTVYSK